MDIDQVREALSHLGYILHVAPYPNMDDVVVVGAERGLIYKERSKTSKDVLVESGHEWTFEEMQQVAVALDVADIDAAPLWEWDEEAEGKDIVRTGGACDTCGHGDAIVVRGVLG